MPITKQRTLDTMEQEWGTYVQRFLSLPEEEQKQRVRKTGYDSLHDLLAHILAWWEEGMSIIRAIAEGREFERKRYDFDAFNAEAVARYRDWDDAKFMAHFEETRQKMGADFGSMDKAIFENRRVRNWLNGILFLHAREHLLTPSRFLLIDLLQNEWMEYPEIFERLDQTKKNEFLTEHGYENFHALLSHIIGWWEDGLHLTRGILNNTNFTWTEPDTDQFNLELVEKYASWSDSDLLRHYDTVRLALIDLVASLPDDAFHNRDIERWLAEDVVEHYDEHALPQ